MSLRDDQAHLLDVAHAARLIVRFSDQTDAKDFEDELMVQSAILHQFLVLGEATKRVSSDFKNAHPEIPWRQMAGMRDRIIHGYDIVNLPLVWRTAIRDVPALLRQIEPLLPDPGRTPDDDDSTIQRK